MARMKIGKLKIEIRLILTKRIIKLLHLKALVKSRSGAGLTEVSTENSTAVLNSKCNYTV